jgi:hypothetical protein
MHHLSADDVRGLRLESQLLGARSWRAGERLDTRGPGQVRDVVARVFAVQAQDESAASVGIWARARQHVQARAAGAARHGAAPDEGVETHGAGAAGEGGLRAEDVAAALEVERSIVRLWCLRGTLHLVAAEDCRWLLDLLRPTFARANRARRSQLGLDDELTSRGVAALCGLLEGGCSTRAEIAERLSSLGVPSAGQATVHVIWRAALDGLVCWGPKRDGEATFVLVDDWLPPAPKLDRDAALQRLAQRYLAAYGPARPEDLAAWSGLPPGEARRAWAALGPLAVEVQTAAGQMWLAAAQADRPTNAAPPADEAGIAHGERVAGDGASGPGVRLLPAFDGLWLGYRERDLLLPREHARRLYPGGGLIRPSALLDGRPVGTWTKRSRGPHLDVVADLWQALAPAALEALDLAAQDMGRFLGADQTRVRRPKSGYQGR